MTSHADPSSSSSATTAVDSLSVSASTLPTIPPSNPQDATTSSSSTSTSTPATKAKDKPAADSSSAQLDPTHAVAQPASSSHPDAMASATSIDAATTEAARNAIMAHLQNAGAASLAPLSQRAVDIGTADEAVARQRVGVDAGAARLAKESARLEREAEKADAVLKDIGNVENWAQVLDRDLSVLEETLRIVEEEEVGVEGEEAEGGQVGEDGRPVERKKKGKGKDGWLWGLLQGSGSGS